MSPGEIFFTIYLAGACLTGGAILGFDTADDEKRPPIPSLFRAVGGAAVWPVIVLVHLVGALTSTF